MRPAAVTWFYWLFFGALAYQQLADRHWFACEITTVFDLEIRPVFMCLPSLATKLHERERGGEKERERERGEVREIGRKIYVPMPMNEVILSTIHNCTSRHWPIKIRLNLIPYLARYGHNNTLTIIWLKSSFVAYRHF